MATFDQLGPRQRAIIELVLRRGQTYDEISGMLGMPVPRVRELAREALVELAPATARSVDPQWRGQLADFLLGQQTGPESRATEGHLESSEEARLWASSLLDSLDTLYEDGHRPELPAGAPARAPRRRRRGEPAADRPGGDAAEGRASPRAPGRADHAAARRRDGAPGARVSGPTARRQRTLGLAAGAVVLVLVIGGGVYALTAGGGDQASAPPPPSEAGGAGQPGGGGAPAPGGQPAGGQPGQPRVLGQIPLEALPGEEGEGRAVIAEQQGERAVVIQARGIKGVDEDELLEVWFYNSREEAKSIGAQRVQRGSFQGLGTLPPDWQRFRFIDVSRERADRNPRHSGSSVLRGETRAAQAGLPRGGP